MSTSKQREAVFTTRSEPTFNGQDLTHELPITHPTILGYGSSSIDDNFAERIIAWHKAQGRHDLPWQNTRDPYRIWVSEIMLQQTQVSAVIPYYQRFMLRFPDLASLARATEEAVLEHWSGLGYYARGRNLHRAAKLIIRDHAGEFPRAYQAVCTLPGVGRSTAAAICVFSYGARKAILDGNVKRVLARHEGIEGYPGQATVQERLWRRAEALLPEQNLEPYTQGLMDLGSRVCVRRHPACGLCPVARDCKARREGSIARLPAPRPVKTRPQRETTMLILWHAGRVLLHKRPAPGIWGGLWSFPEVERTELEHAAMRWGSQLQGLKPLQPVEQGFTHYKLRIYPVLAVVGQPRLGTAEAEFAWLQLTDAFDAAIPAPVRRILQALNPNEAAVQLSLPQPTV